MLEINKLITTPAVISYKLEVVCFSLPNVEIYEYNTKYTVLFPGFIGGK